MEIAPGDAASKLHQGQRIDRYELLTLASRGASSATWIARMRSAHGFEKLVVVKAIGAPLATDGVFRDAFLEEVRLASAVAHPNVAHVLDLGERDDLVYTVSEYIDGDALSDLKMAVDQNKGHVPPAIVLRVLSDACAGLHAAHLMRDRSGKLLNVVHGDVSAESILIGVNGVVKVLGFGVSKARARVQDGANGTLLGMADGVPVPPIRQKIDRHADVWAIGATLYPFVAHLFVGLARPHDARDESAPAASVPYALAALVERATSNDPAVRFATAAEMQGAIEAALATLGMPTTSANVAGFAAQRFASRAAARVQAVDAALTASSTSNLDSLGPIASSVDSQRPSPIHSPLPVASSSVRPRPLVVVRPPPMVQPAEPAAKLQAIIPAPLLGPLVPLPRLTRLPRALAAAGSAIALGALGFFGAQQLYHPLRKVTVQVVSAAAIAPPTLPPCLPSMIEIPGGKFYMGSDDDLDLEKPAHHVTIAPYCIDRYEVTVESYKACSDAGDCKRATTENKWDGITKAESKVYDPLCNVREPMARAKHPINCVDWQMAKLYCEAHGGRLPTEAEWEFAARGPDGRKYPWGDEEPSALELNACGKECLAWAKKNKVELESMYGEDDGWPNTAPVGSFPAGRSRYGLYDVVGNVWEWVQDHYAPYGPEPLVDPSGPPSGDARVIRGGAWNGSYSSWVRPTFRYKNAPDMRSYGIGFRCAKSR